MAVALVQQHRQVVGAVLHDQVGLAVTIEICELDEERRVTGRVIDPRGEAAAPLVQHDADGVTRGIRGGEIGLSSPLMSPNRYGPPLAIPKVVPMSWVIAPRSRCPGSAAPPPCP